MSSSDVMYHGRAALVGLEDITWWKQLRSNIGSDAGCVSSQSTAVAWDMNRQPLTRHLIKAAAMLELVDLLRGCAERLD